MANNVVYRAPKRRIEKVVSRLNHSITNSTTESILHTVEDRKTLVRTVIDLWLVVASGAPSWNIVMHRQPRGQSVGSPSTSESLDADQVTEQMYDAAGVALAGSLEPIHLQVDLKGQRKLSPGDEIVLKDTCNVVSGMQVAGTVTQFFKE